MSGVVNHNDSEVANQTDLIGGDDIPMLQPGSLSFSETAVSRTNQRKEQIVSRS